ncbi:MAG: tyrosine-protein phosphatase [Lentisphaeria bacterium]|nr:tyrosine-protein phosphatase [Lentisphaeria bacterium]
MKKIWICSLLCGMMIVLLAGCIGIPPERNYIGMTKAEVAAHLERYAERSRWSKNRFAIEISVIGVATPYWFNNSGEVSKNSPVMSANEWRCDFFPQSYPLLGWNGMLAKWYFWILEFKDGRVVKQLQSTYHYGRYGHAGESPYPQFPKNFHKVNENLYRSGLPDEDEFESLYTFNEIRSVLNLRENNSDKDEIDAVNKKWKTAVALYEIPLDTGNISEDDLYKILTVIRDAPKPLLIHCWHGSDRTGCAVAAYRIVFENWNVEEAISELMKPEYGHHRNIYTNIPELLRKADWQKIRAAILNNEK